MSMIVYFKLKNVYAYYVFEVVYQSENKKKSVYLKKRQHHKKLCHYNNCNFSGFFYSSKQSTTIVR